MRFDIITIFPEMFDGVLKVGLFRIVREKGLAEFHLHNLRDYATDKHKSVDDRPYGGGPGMVMMPEPIFRAVETIEKMDETPPRKILLTPQGDIFDQKMAIEFSREKRLMFICGRYEGFDERVRQGLNVEEVSIGEYVLSGGELAAMVIMESVIRLLPGALGHEESAWKDSFVRDGLLDYPQYTRPPEFRGMKVPEVLLSGNHQEIAKWREEQARIRTEQRRCKTRRRDN